LDYAVRVSPGFQCPPHVRLMAEHLERLERGEIRRLLVAVSVRHGKSVLCSQVFPSWFLGRNPTSEVVLASYAADLAERSSRLAKGYVESAMWPFMDAELSSDSKANTRWNLAQGGGCRAIGVGGGITGRGSDLLVIDDPHDRSSDADRETAWTWYREIITPRLNAGARVILVSARFHDQDLAGRIQESEEADQWTVLRIPAICDSEDDPIGRAIGEPLWPEHMSLEEIEKRRVAMGSSAFSAQFQQCPQPAGGRMFASEWFENRYESVPRPRAPAPCADQYTTLGTDFGNGSRDHGLRTLTIQACDSAWKDGPSNDRSVIATLTTDFVDIYITDVWADRLKYPELRAAVVQAYRKHMPRGLYVEEASSGFALVAELRSSTGIPIIAVPPGRDSKIARAESVTGLFEAGRVKFPKSAPWLEDALSELLRFPYAKHDDVVDAIVLGVRTISDLMRRDAANAAWRQRNQWVFAGWMER